MRVLVSILFSILLSINYNFSNAQESYSTIYFYRIRSNADRKKPLDIFINDRKIGEISTEGRIQYKIFSEGEAEIYAKTFGCETTRIHIVIQKNTEYYVKVDGITCFLKEFDIQKGKYDYNNPSNFRKSVVNKQEDISNPIPLKPIQTNRLADFSQTGEVISQPPQVVNRITTPVAFKSDVDENIPVSKQVNDKTFVVIIANENYQKEVPVQFAINDGRVFKEYCEKTLGIPTQNIHFAQDATFGNMRSEIKWLTDVAQAYSGKAKIIFYYAGHGMPNEKDRTAFLLPVDGFSSDYETAINLDDLYNRLNEHPTQSITVFLDACFSGSIRDDGMLASARAVRVKPKENVIKGNTVVFSAATGEETAYPYIEKQHGLFTYFLLKKLQETEGNVDFQTLSDYIIENVKRQAIVVNQKPQTPQVNTSIEIQDTWHKLKLK